MGKVRLIGISIAALAAVASLAFAVHYLFSVRRPVVVVTDDAFETLYGPARAERQRKAASLRLFRPILSAVVAESASPLAAAESAAAASLRPFRVVFPSRYEDGAAVYARRFPDISTVVVGGNADSDDTAVFGRILPDGETDLYRAGRMAALFSREGGRPLLVVPESMDPAAFAAGLADGGFAGEPSVISPTAPVPSAGGFSCLIAAAPLAGSPALELKELPVVLFSWIDPNLVPRRTVVLFDDSVLALLVDAARSALGGKDGRFPSKVWFPGGSGRKVTPRLKAAAAARYPAHNSL